MGAMEKITEALEIRGCKGRNGSYQCPSHDDRHESLSVRETRPGGIGIKCHTGCTAEEIMGALGMSTADLFDERPHEVARYNYLDMNGTVKFAKIRMEPKSFVIMHPTDTGWEYGVNGAERPLYRLQDVAWAISQGLPVFFVEGEKDADRLAELGVTATCNFGGAGEWRDEYAELLKGADVTIVADRDEPGERHARRIRASLRGKARVVRIVQSKTEGSGHDVSDHLDNGYELSDLVPLAGPYKAVSLAALVRKGVPSPVLLGDFLYEGGLHSIAGAPDCGKTTLALFWALSLVRQGRNVLFLDEEGGQEIVAEKLVALGASHSDLDSLLYIPFPGRSWSESDIASLLDLAEEVTPALLLVDSSAAFMARAGLDETRASDVTRFWAQVLTPVARQVGAAVLVIDHDTKSTEQSRYARGSGAKLCAIDVQVKVTLEKPFTREQDGDLRVIVTKDRRGYLCRHWDVQMKTAGGNISPYFHRSVPDQSVTGAPPARRAIYGVLDDTPRTYHEINDMIFQAEERHLKRETVSKELNELRRQGLVDCVESLGRESRWYKVSL